jgi:hypothetical protein
VNGELTAFEFKWKNRKKAKIPKSFINAYEPTTEIIDHENFREILE